VLFDPCSFFGWLGCRPAEWEFSLGDSCVALLFLYSLYFSFNNIYSSKKITL